MTPVMPWLFLAACTAPVLAPATELAGSHRIGTDGIAAEDVTDPTPFSAWTAAAPLTLVGPGGVNLAILDRFGVRVEVLQVKPGRVRVRCTRCDGEATGAEGWFPRNVLWVQPPAETPTPPTARDPLNVMLHLRARWAKGLDVPTGTSANALCWLADHGLTVDAGSAIATAGTGRLQIQREGAEWRLTALQAPAAAPPWTCSSAAEVVPG